MYVCISLVQLFSRVRLFATPWIAARQASLSITNSRSSLKLMSIESVMPSSHVIKHGIFLYIYTGGFSPLWGDCISKSSICRCFLLHVSNSSVTPWTATRQAPLSMGFPRQRILEGVAISSRESLPDPGTEPTSPAWQADSLPVSRLGSPFKSITQLQNPEERSTIHSWGIQDSVSSRLPE